MTDNYNYYYDEYYDDVAKLVDRYANVVNPHIVGIYRGSLPIATHLSNVLECPMSIIKFQSRDGKDTKAEWLLDLTSYLSCNHTSYVFDVLKNGLPPNIFASV